MCAFLDDTRWLGDVVDIRQFVRDQLQRCHVHVFCLSYVAIIVMCLSVLVLCLSYAVMAFSVVPSSCGGVDNHLTIVGCGVHRMHIAGRLEREGTSSDISIRSQVQSESVQTGLTMQHLGALLLELGRTIITFQAESAVNAGPAVYISPSGPNPIMVQPFPLQTSSLFGGPVPSSTPAAFGPIGIGSVPRNVSIHIHAGTSLAPVVSPIGSRPNNGEGTRGEHHSEPGYVVGVASSTQTGFGVSTPQPSSDSTPLSSVLAGLNSRLRDFVGQMESTSQDLPAGSEPRPPLGNEQLDTVEMNGFRAASVPSVGCTSETGVQKTPEILELSKEIKEKLKEADQCGIIVI
ncbi:hypothetical protein RIF29_41151 [Crotalaria pallida]|uniref:Uncharacterized protein n=1 Tax=Crotalaria pallida TaxID=3830 RepID=A0AAN9E4I1_CROPI